MKSRATELPTGVFELEGMLVKAKSGATSSFEEYLAAGATFIEINADTRWNPWVRDDRAGEIDAAMTVMEQRTRAEPDFHQMTEQEIDEMLAQVGPRALRPMPGAPGVRSLLDTYADSAAPWPRAHASDA